MRSEPQCSSQLSKVQTLILDLQQWTGSKARQKQEIDTRRLHWIYLIYIFVRGKERQVYKLSGFIPYRAARVVGEVDLGKSHVNDQYFHAHNAALIAVLVLGNNGHLGFS